MDFTAKGTLISASVTSAVWTTHEGTAIITNQQLVGDQSYATIVTNDVGCSLIKCVATFDDGHTVTPHYFNIDCKQPTCPT